MVPGVVGEIVQGGGGGEFQPISQEQRHGGEKQGRVPVTCSPDSGGIK